MTAKVKRRVRRIYRTARPSYSRKLNLPMAVILGFVPLVTRGVQLVQAGGVTGLQALPSSLIPYDFQARKVTFANLGSGLYPIIAGLAVHKFVGGMLGVNRALAASRIPWIRI
jgi:hypothetical protein